MAYVGSHHQMKCFDPDVPAQAFLNCIISTRVTATPQPDLCCKSISIAVVGSGMSRFIPQSKKRTIAQPAPHSPVLPLSLVSSNDAHSISCREFGRDCLLGQPLRPNSRLRSVSSFSYYDCQSRPLSAIRSSIMGDVEATKSVTLPRSKHRKATCAGCRKRKVDPKAWSISIV